MARNKNKDSTTNVERLLFFILLFVLLLGSGFLVGRYERTDIPENPTIFQQESDAEQE